MLRTEWPVNEEVNGRNGQKQLKSKIQGDVQSLGYNFKDVVSL